MELAPAIAACNHQSFLCGQGQSTYCSHLRFLALARTPGWEVPCWALPAEVPGPGCVRTVSTPHGALALQLSCVCCIADRRHHPWPLPTVPSVWSLEALSSRIIQLGVGMRPSVSRGLCLLDSGWGQSLQVSCVLHLCSFLCHALTRQSRGPWIQHWLSESS